MLSAPRAALVLAMAATAGRRLAIAAAFTEAGRLAPLRVTPAWMQRQTRTDALRVAATLVVCCVHGRIPTPGMVSVLEPETLEAVRNSRVSIASEGVSPRLAYASHVLTQRLR